MKTINYYHNYKVTLVKRNVVELHFGFICFREFEHRCIRELKPKYVKEKGFMCIFDHVV